MRALGLLLLLLLAPAGAVAQSESEGEVATEEELPDADDESIARSDLEEADRELKDGDAIWAEVLYRELVARYPGTSAAKEARITLRKMERNARAGRAARRAASRFQPLVLLERTDLVASLLVYGGISGALLTGAAKLYGAEVAGVLMGGAMFGAVGAVLEVNSGQLAIVEGLVLMPAALSLLVWGAAGGPNSGDPQVGQLLGSLISVISLPVAALVAPRISVSPGDPYLVRDGAFWGGVFGLLLGVGSTSQLQMGLGAIGLVTGLGLGFGGAYLFEATPEQMRLINLCGYVGLLVATAALSSSGTSRNGLLMTAITAGGLALGAGFTAHFAYLEEEDEAASKPLVLPLRAPDGRITGLVAGFSGTF
jgi:hypothetical protein